MTNLAAEVARSLQSSPIEDADAGAAFLATRYAALIDAFVGTPDEVSVLKDLGPKLLATLDALGRTTKARGVKKQEDTSEPDPGAATLDELRRRRQRRTG